MTGKSEAEQKVEAMEFMAPIIEAQMRFDQQITNQLQVSAWEDAEKWATRFRDLIERIEAVNDSVKVARIIDAHWVPDIDRTISHYKTMQGKFAEAI